MTGEEEEEGARSQDNTHATARSGCTGTPRPGTISHIQHILRLLDSPFKRGRPGRFVVGQSRVSTHTRSQMTHEGGLLKLLLSREKLNL